MQAPANCTPKVRFPDSCTFVREMSRGEVLLRTSTLDTTWIRAGGKAANSYSYYSQNQQPILWFFLRSLHGSVSSTEVSLSR